MNDSALFAVVTLGLGIWLVMGLASLYNHCKWKAIVKRRLKELRDGN